MSFASPKDTLEYQIRGRPLTVKRDMSLISTVDVAARLVEVEPMLGSGAIPDTVAIRFYLLEQALSGVYQRVGLYEPLGPLAKIPMAYHEHLTSEAVRMFYYLLLICTRESRHVTWSTDAKAKFVEHFGPELASFNKAILAKGEQAAVGHLRKSPPKVEIGKYTSSLVYLFDKVEFPHSFGGKKWAAVAKVLNDFVHGKLTAAMMMDVGWTLCHNNGPIFNKGMLYGPYTEDLIRILDVQRSGQVAQLVATRDLKHKHLVTPLEESLRLEFQKLLGVETMGGFVDWFQVEALGSKGKYPAEKKKQLVNGLGTKSPTGEPGLGSSQILGLLEIMPDVTVPIVERPSGKK